MTRRPGREELLVAAAGSLWALGFLLGEPAVAASVVPLVGLGLALHRVRPVLGYLAVLAGQVLVFEGTTQESPAALVPFLVAVYALGRHAPPVRGVPLLAGSVVAAAVADGFNPPTVVFMALVVGGTFAFGLVVRRRTDAALSARRRAGDLGARDPATVASRVVAEERARLAGTTVTVVTDAVLDMMRQAEVAVDTLAPSAITRIQERGAAAVGELRRLLGLLRGDERDAPDSAASTTPDPRPRVSDVVLTATLVVVAVGELVILAQTAPVHVLVLAPLLPLVVLLRRWRLWLASASAAVLTGLATLMGEPLPYVFAQTVLLVLLAWWTATEGGRLVWGAFAALAAVSLLVTYLSAPENIPMAAALTGLPLLAGRAWSESARAERDAVGESERLQETLDRTVHAAVRAEKLRLARELHDVTSHAVGVMVLQAGAAAALRTQPERARAALRQVLASGADAQRDLARLGSALEAGAVGRTGVTSVPAPDLGTGLRALAARIRAAGNAVSLELVDLPQDPEIGAVVLRVVQEALTNVVRHAPRSPVEVRVTGGVEAVEVLVVDEGTGRTDTTTGPGFGLVGLAERVRALGGDVHSGPRTVGGFEVRATIPHGSLEAPQRPTVGPVTGQRP